MKRFSKLLIALYLFILASSSFFPGVANAKGGGGKGHSGISHPFGGKHTDSSSGKSSSYKSLSGSHSHSKAFSYKKSKSYTSKAKLNSSGSKSRSYLAPAGGYKHVRYSDSNVFDSTIKRDSNGHIVRSESAKHEFLKMHGYNDEVPTGYQVDHIIPLYAGGKDTPSNMQLISIAQHQAKTKADYEKYGR